jgi:hypothetical protein
MKTILFLLVWLIALIAGNMLPDPWRFFSLLTCMAIFFISLSAWLELD